MRDRVSLDWKLFISIYAAILSTGVFFWNVLKSRRWIRIRIGHGVAHEGDDVISGVWVSIENCSDKPAFIRAVSVLYPYRSASILAKAAHFVKYRNSTKTVGWVFTSPKYVEIETGLPKEIQPGDSHGFLLPEEKLLKLTENRVRDEIMVSAQDALAMDSFSKVFGFKEVDDRILAK